jgi:hypothetical protein
VRSVRAARSREFAFVLHSVERLKQKMVGAARAAWGIREGSGVMVESRD